MYKVYFYVCIAVLSFSCNVNQRMSNSELRIVTSIRSFKSKEDIVRNFANIWTGVVDTASSVRQGDEIFTLLHDSCSGLYCPSFYVYKNDLSQDLSWNLVFTEKIIRDDGNTISGPKKIVIYDQTIDLLNWNQVKVKTYLIDSIIN